MVGYVTQLSVCFGHLFPHKKLNHPFENFTDLFSSFRILLLLLLRCWAGPDGDANVSPQKPILLQGHERSITQIKYNREGDLLFSVAKDTVSRTADRAFIHTNVFGDELIRGVSCEGGQCLVLCQWWEAWNLQWSHGSCLVCRLWLYPFTNYTCGVFLKLNISVQDVHSGAIYCFFNLSTLRGH